MKRDRGLLVAMALMVFGAVVAVIHYIRMIGWIENWDQNPGSVELENCWDCYAYQFYGGDLYQLGAVVSFVVALYLIFRSWRKSGE